MGQLVYKESVVKTGIGFGSALAMVISFYVNQSILWAMIHGVMGWIYVVYRALVGGY